MPAFSTSPEPSPGQPLLDRVQERVDAAAARLSAHQRRALDARGDNPLEHRALRRVFREMGRNQRNARRRTGQAPSAVVRHAAVAFRQNPSLPALVLVAASLDEAGLLFW